MITQLIGCTFILECPKLFFVLRLRCINKTFIIIIIITNVASNSNGKILLILLSAPCMKVIQYESKSSGKICLQPVSKDTSQILPKAITSGAHKVCKVYANLPHDSRSCLLYIFIHEVRGHS